MQTLLDTRPHVPPVVRLSSLIGMFPLNMTQKTGVKSGGSTPGKTVDMKHLADCIRAIAASKDRQAFEELFRFYAPRLKAVLMKSGASAQEAEEVMQEAMVLVWRKAEQFDSSKASASTCTTG